MGKLKGKTALITGGSSGIGLATAKLFIEEGATVIITGRDAEKLMSAKASIGEQLIIHQSNASQPDEIENLVSKIKQDHQQLDILFINAGIAKAAPIEFITEELFDEIISANVKGAFFLIKHALPLLNKNASVIVTTSITNKLGCPNFSLYGASKAALRSMVQSLALELISRGIRVNAINPGPIETPIYSKFGVPNDVESAIKEDIERKSPIGRFGRPEEIAKSVLFLATEDSSYLVGEEIVVDGGMSLL
ncbi:SDR family oxidoreductase [Parachitinimonas caeni]|uniref:SDR family oxidoreductase n=1 Tax=Parachitinimonas caeni TaxID=3031301 RepID=A0ABT7E3J7_9NEIS|nr:SDR family oxidoreductase [Parachitinimonas caeni]MDK2126891.1 SDR family oxidoreductase [Parachitinimonas caeni]